MKNKTKSTSGFFNKNNPNYGRNMAIIQKIGDVGLGLLAQSGYTTTPTTLGANLANAIQLSNQNDRQRQDDRYKRAMLGLQMKKYQSQLDNPDANAPAALRLANEYEKALSSGNKKRAANIAAFSKAFDKGIVQGTDGGFQAAPGYGSALGDIKQEVKKSEVIGKDQAEKEVALNSQISKLPQLEDTVAKLSELGQNATYTYAGRARDALARQSGIPLPESAIARSEYIALVDNQILPLLRDTFGAAFTQKEGESLKATLGDPNKSPEEKDAVLRSFIDQKKQNVMSLQRELGYQPVIGEQSQPQAAGQRKSLNDIFGY